jgi:hypothetical protein
MAIITSHHHNTVDAYASKVPEYAEEWRQLARRSGSLLREAAEMRTKALDLDTSDATDEQAEQAASLMDRVDAFNRQADVLAEQMLELYETIVAEADAEADE